MNKIKISERGVTVIQKILIVVGSIVIIVGFAADWLGLGTSGFGFGPIQGAVILVGLSVTAWSVTLRFKRPLKRSLYSIILATILFLLWSFWLYPTSGYHLNPFWLATFASKVFVVSHLFILFLSVVFAGIAAWEVWYDPLKTRKGFEKVKPQNNEVTSSYSVSWDANHISVIVFAAFVTVLMVGCCFFISPSEWIDDLSLYNPIYMYLTYGKMTYPVHGYFEAMFVHPPLRYLTIAWLMKLGFNSFYASSFLVFAVFFLGVFMIVSSCFYPREKIALLFGLLAPLIFLPRLCTSIRPDVSLALGWFTGLVILESARIEGWTNMKLFLGSSVLTFSAGLHYYGWVSCAGLFVYCIYALYDLRLRAGISKVIVMFIGAFCVGLPYLVFFVLPQLNNIVFFSHVIQGSGGIWDAFNRHMDQYFYNLQTFPADRSPYILMFFRPVWSTGIPLALFAWIFLAIPRNTRGFALSSIFLPVFVCFYSRGKYAWYYMPETMIYLSGIALIFLALIQVGASRLFAPRHTKYALSLATLCLIFVCLKGNILLQSVNISLKPYHHDMHLARACAQEMLGSDAVVAGRLSLWYVSGARHWYNLTSDLLWKKDLSKMDLSAYFSQFNAVVEYQHMANITENNFKATLSSWYADGILHFRGFFLTNNPSDLVQGFYVTDTLSDLNFLIFSGTEHKRNEVIGFGVYNHDLLYRFERDPQGDYILANLIGPLAEILNELKAQSLFFHRIPLPGPKSQENISVDYRKTKRNIYTFVLPRKEYEKLSIKFDSNVKVRETIPCRMVPDDQNTLLKKLKQDCPMKFYHSIEELLAEIST